MARLPERISEAEFLSWPETRDKVELIDGDVVCSPAASYGHQEVLRRLVGALSAWAAGRDVTVCQSPLDLRIAPGRIVQPDAFVVRGRLSLRTPSPLKLVPELCVEVLSSNAAHDRRTKRLLYAAAGVKELWTVSLDGYVERWSGASLTEWQAVTTTLRTPILLGLELDVRALFADP